MRLFVFMLLAALTVIAVDSQSRDSEIDHPNEINLTLNPNWMPFNWVTNGTPEGVGILAASAIFEPHGVNVNIVDRGTWGNAQKSVERGDDDGAIAAYNVTKRWPYSVFSNGYAKDPVVIFFPKERPFFYKDFNDLVGHTFIVLPDESYGESVDAQIRSGEIKVAIADNSSQAFQRLREDRSIDGFLHTYWGGRLEAGYQNLYGNTSEVDNPDICIQISKKSPWSTPENMSLINAWETEVRKSGDVEKWLEQTVA